MRIPDSEVHAVGATMLNSNAARARMDNIRCCFMISGIGLCWNERCASAMRMQERVLLEQAVR